MRSESGGDGALIWASMSGSSVSRRSRGAIVYGVTVSFGRVGSGRVGSASSVMEFIANWNGIH